MLVMKFDVMGSSPRVRGTVDGARLLAQAVVDHPRACGEQDDLIEDPRLKAGSSPRVRGTAVRRT